MIKTRPTKLSQAILLSTLFVGATAHATSFLPQDPRALAMGGATVAAGNSSQAHYYNPSLLHNAPEDEDFNWEIDATARVSDTDHLLEAMNDFGEDEIVPNFNSSIQRYIDAFNAFGTNFSNLTPDTVNEFIDAQTALKDASVNLQNGLQNITGKSLAADINAGTAVSVPNLETVSGAFYFNFWSNFSLQGDLGESDNNTMTALIDLLDFQRPNNPADLAAQQQAITNAVNTFENFNTDEDLDSTVSMTGGFIQEFGLALATNYSLNGYDFDVGVTPKYMVVTTTDLIFELSDLDEDNDVTNDEQTKDYTTFNADIGLSKRLGENWKTGFVIKNIIPQSFDTPSKKSKVKIDPAARVGASYRNNWVTVGADFDLTENDSIGGFSKTRFLSLGAELDVWLLKLRAGYRANLAGGGNIPSVGVGLYLFGVNADIAVAGNQFDAPNTLEEATELDDYSVAARIGIQW